MSALKAGYRHLDTAAVYRNERQVGHAIRDFLHQNQSMSRDQLFVTGKLPPNGMNPSRVEHFLRRTLQLLDLQYLDLYLIHAPFAVKVNPTDST